MISKNCLKKVEDLLNTNFKPKKSKLFVKEFEEKFSKKFNCKYGISCCNGTATLHGILMGMGVKDGDEVITTPLTMSSTSLCILHCNALPVYADVELDTFQISPSSIKSKITPRTKAIITVSLYGLCPEMDEIMEIAKENNLYVIEDNAECFLGEYKNKIVGSIGHASSFSFQNSKHMTTGEGGIILTNDIKLQDSICKSTILGYQTVGELAPKFDNKQFRDPAFKRHVAFGYNYRMSELCCAVAIEQLDILDYLVEQRILIANKFNDVLIKTKCDWLIPQKVNDYIKHSYWGFTVRLNRDDISFIQFRDKFMEYGGKAPYACWELAYLEPLFEKKKLKEYQWQEFDKGLCKNAEYLQSRIISFQNNYIDDDLLKSQLNALENVINFYNRKIIAVIYCRLGSKRLPNKGLMKINNLESICRTILNIKKMNVDDIILATGDSDQNLELKQYATKYNIKFISGSEENLLSRTIDTINFFNLTENDYILRVTADDVCRSYEIANFLINKLKNENDENNKFDYISNYPDDCPIGLGSEILSVKSIFELNKFIKENSEYLTFFYAAFKKMFNIKLFKLPENYKLNIILTLDTYDDYEKINNLYTFYNIKNESINIEKIIEYFKDSKKEKKICLGNSPDEILQILNNQCSSYKYYNKCYDIDYELSNL